MTSRAIRRYRRRSTLAPNAIDAPPELKRSYLIWSRLQARYRLWAKRGRRGPSPLEARWIASFDDFYADLGPVPENHTVRPLDPSQPIGPNNCRLVALPPQRDGAPRKGVAPRLIRAGGIERSVREWAEALSIPEHTLRYRLWKGQTIEDHLAAADPRPTSAVAA